VRTTRRPELAAACVEITGEQPDGPDHLRVEAAFGDLHHAERVVWMLGAAAEALAPAALRARVAARAAAVAAFYA
jgi:predicted DNA-binding transcriptional regulator YafY